MTKTENLTFIYNPLDWTLGPIGPSSIRNIIRERCISRIETGLAPRPRMGAPQNAGFVAEL